MTAGPRTDRVPALPRELTSRGQRERLLAGALGAVVERGYRATTVAHIVTAAGVSRATFYDCFANKEDCVLATYDLIVDWVGARIAQAVRGIEDWPDAVRAAVHAVLESLDAEPRSASFCTIEILHLGRVGFARYEASIEDLAIPLRAGRARCPWGTELPIGLEQTVVGGAVWLIGYRTQLDGPGRLTELADDIVYFLLTPYLDASAAKRPAANLG
jgi:AcrR family transcriptional regulator